MRHVVLGPGESWSGEVFYLEEEFEFSGDAEDAAPTNPLEPEVVRTGATRVFDGSYDADVTIGEVEGEGKDAVLPVTIVQRGLADGMIERLWSASEDVFFVRGLDAEGNVDVNAYDWIFSVEEGQTETLNIPLGDGPSNDQEVMNFFPTSAVDEAVTWELAAFQPVMLEDARPSSCVGDAASPERIEDRRQGDQRDEPEHDERSRCWRRSIRKGSTPDGGTTPSGWVTGTRCPRQNWQMLARAALSVVAWQPSHGRTTPPRLETCRP